MRSLLRLLRLVRSRECPQCHKVLDRAELARHLQRHTAGQRQYQRIAFTVAGPGFTLERVAILFRRTKSGWVTVRSARTIRLLEQHEDLAATVDAHLRLLNDAAASIDPPVFAYRPPFAAAEPAASEPSLQA